MEEEKNDLTKSCWNKYKEIHSDKIVYLNKIYNIFIKLTKILIDFDIQYKSLEIEKFINPIENNKINETIKLINKSLISFINTSNTMMKNILNTFKDIYESLKNENLCYDRVLLNYMQYDEEKQKMNQIKNSFIEKMRVIEDSIKLQLIKKSDIKIDAKEMGDAIKDFENYKACLTEVNKKRFNFNKSQNDLLKLYQKIFMEKEGDLYQTINVNFYLVEKDKNDSTSVNIEKMKKIKKINKKEYNKEIISFYHSEEKPEEEIEVSNYYLKHKPYPTSPASAFYIFFNPVYYFSIRLHLKQDILCHILPIFIPEYRSDHSASVTYFASSSAISKWPGSCCVPSFWFFFFRASHLGASKRSPQVKKKYAFRFR